MSETDLQMAFKQFCLAHDSLISAADFKGHVLYPEVLSNRFRLCYETIRSCLKRLMIYLSVDETLDSGWKIFETAIAQGLITQNADWFPMITDRNTLAHEYFEPVMMEICERIETLYLPLFAGARQMLKTEIQRLNQGNPT